MTFIHGYLLAGLLLAGVPVLLHLIMRQKPRTCSSPLSVSCASGISSIAASYVCSICSCCSCAWVSSRRCASRWPGRAAAERVASLFNTSDPSPPCYLRHQPQHGIQRRRPHAPGRSQQRAGELLDEMDAGSQLALLDSGDERRRRRFGVDVAGPAQTRIDGLASARPTRR